MRRQRTFTEAALGLLSAAVFVVLFYLWGEDLLPRAAGRYGQMFPFIGAVALTLAVALFLTEWFGFAGREVRKVRLAVRDFLFLCSLALALFVFAKGVMDILPGASSFRGGNIPPRIYVYLIPIPAFAMVEGSGSTDREHRRLPTFRRPGWNRPRAGHPSVGAKTLSVQPRSILADDRGT